MSESNPPREVLVRRRDGDDALAADGVSEVKGWRRGSHADERDDDEAQPRPTREKAAADGRAGANAKEPSSACRARTSLSATALASQSYGGASDYCCPDCACLQHSVSVKFPPSLIN